MGIWHREATSGRSVMYWAVSLFGRGFMRKMAEIRPNAKRKSDN